MGEESLARVNWKVLSEAGLECRSHRTSCKLDNYGDVQGNTASTNGRTKARTNISADPGTSAIAVAAFSIDAGADVGPADWDDLWLHKARQRVVRRTKRARNFGFLESPYIGRVQGQVQEGRYLHGSALRRNAKRPSEPELQILLRPVHTGPLNGCVERLRHLGLL